ncbi:MAG: hypothetical protein N2319_00545 [Candidatus Kapabacteria bacterium]|nr:hypothetical protein [Candidatus Kapabacteria bacterium]
MKIRLGQKILGVLFILPILAIVLNYNSYGFMLDPVFDRDIQIDKISVSGYTVRTALSYDYIDNSFKKRNFITDLIYFNENGYPSEKIFYNDNGEILKSEKYFYDESSNLISIIVLIPGDPSNYDLNFKYEKDENGRITKRYAYNSEGILISYYVYSYSGDNLISEEKFSSDNISISRIYYNYDSNKKLTKTTEYRMSAGNPFIYLVHNYNSKGLIERTIQYTNDGKVFSSCEQKYDAYNNLIESICRNAQGKLHWKYTLNYNDKNLISEKVVYSDETTPYEKIVYNYENEEESNKILGIR